MNQDLQHVPITYNAQNNLHRLAYYLLHIVSTVDIITEDVAETEIELIDRAADRLFHDPLPAQIAIAVPHPICNFRLLPILISFIIVIIDE